MNWVADENVDQPIITALRQVGHLVWAVAEQHPGLRDDDLLRQANRDSAILITADKDFGELVFRRELVTHGVLLIRLAGAPAARKASLVVSAVERHGAAMRGAFCVLERSALRIRRRP